MKVKIQRNTNRYSVKDRVFPVKFNETPSMFYVYENGVLIDKFKEREGLKKHGCGCD